MKILIVDDEPPARARLLHLIHDLELGEVVGEAGNGRDALAATDTSHPDVILLDIRMPGMDGLEVARHLSGLEHPPSVIFTTAFGAAERALVLLGQGGIDRRRAAEDLAPEQGVCDTGARDDDEGSGAARAPGVHRPGQVLLARSGRPTDADREIPARGR